MSVVTNGVPRDDGQGILIALAAAAVITVAATPGRTRSRERSQVLVQTGESPEVSDEGASLPMSKLGRPVAVLPAWARSSTTVPKRGVFSTQARPFPRSDSVWKRQLRPERLPKSFHGFVCAAPTASDLARIACNPGRSLSGAKRARTADLLRAKQTEACQPAEILGVVSTQKPYRYGLVG